MPTPRSARSSTNAASGRNLFLDADPDPDVFAAGGSEERGARRRPARHGPRRGLGLVVPVDESSTGTMAGGDAARFTRASRRAGGLLAVRARLQRADVRAGEVLRHVAARRYGALVAAALLVVVLICVSGLALALRDAFASRGAAERGRIAAIAGLRGEEARLERLSAELDQTSALARRAEQARAAAIASWRLRALTAERRLARARPGRGMAYRHDRGAR